MKIALIVGHSQEKQGASNLKNKQTEYEFNKQLVKLVARKLRDLSHDTIIVYRDCSYYNLPDKVNKTQADIAVSFHCNAFDRKTSGSETLFYKGSVKGRILACNIQKQIVKCLKTEDRGIKSKTIEDRGGFLLKNTSMPCVIAEPFFIDHDESLELAYSKFDELAEAYATGIINFNINP